MNDTLKHYMINRRDALLAINDKALREARRLLDWQIPIFQEQARRLLDEVIDHFDEPCADVSQDLTFIKKGVLSQSRKQADFLGSLDSASGCDYTKSFIASCNSDMLVPFVHLTGCDEKLRKIDYEIRIYPHPSRPSEGRYREALMAIKAEAGLWNGGQGDLSTIEEIADEALSPSGERKGTPREALEQAIRDYDIIQGGDSAMALIDWLESTTSFVYDKEEGDSDA